MPPTGRATPWDGYIDLVSRPACLQCTPATVLFFMQVRLPKPPLAPIPRSAATSRTVQTPKTRQVMNTVLEFRPAESPISWHRGHMAHVGMISLKLKRLSSQARSAHHFPCVFGPSGDERCKLVNP